MFETLAKIGSIPKTPVDTKSAFVGIEGKARARVAAFYLQRLTKPELRQVGEFVGSETGAKFARKVPKLLESIDAFKDEDASAVEALERKANAVSLVKRKLIAEMLALPGVAHWLSRPQFILDIQLVPPPGVAAPIGAAEARARELNQQHHMRERLDRATKAQQIVFLGNEFSESELRAILAYLKGDGGSAVTRLKDEVEAVAADVMLKAALSVVPRLTGRFCDERKCSAEEREEVAEMATQFRDSARSMITLKPQ
jgi:hypothetical protein